VAGFQLKVTRAVPVGFGLAAEAVLATVASAGGFAIYGSRNVNDASDVNCVKSAYKGLANQNPADDANNKGTIESTNPLYPRVFTAVFCAFRQKIAYTETVKFSYPPS
jgi:hypothetical protein